MNVILTVRAWYNKARDMQTSKEQHGQMSKLRLHKCISMLQETKAAPGCSEDIVAANGTYKVRTAVRIIDDSRDH